MTTEREMVEILRRRYNKVSIGAHRYAVADHVPSRPWGGARICDFVAVDCHKMPHHPMHGHEIKCSRSDWLTELRDPSKSEAFSQFMDFWWLVVDNAEIVKPGELPEGWGLMVRWGKQLRVRVQAVKREKAPMPYPMTVALLRATAKSARSVQGDETNG